MSMSAPATRPSSASPYGLPSPHVGVSKGWTAPEGQRKLGSLYTEAGTHSAQPSVHAHPVEDTPKMECGLQFGAAGKLSSNSSYIRLWPTSWSTVIAALGSSAARCTAPFQYVPSVEVGYQMIDSWRHDVSPGSQHALVGSHSHSSLASS